MTRAWLTDYRILYDSPQRLFSALKTESIEAHGITETANGIELSVNLLQKNQLIKLLENLGAEYEVTGQGFMCRAVDFFRRRTGLWAGAAVCTAAILVSRNFMLNVEVLSENEIVREEVTNVLHEYGVKTGAYIPSLNFPELERTLKQRVESISWAGVSVTNSSLIIDVIENIEQPQKHSERMPSDLVAAHTGTIDKIEIYNGLLVKPVGSGVLRGEVIVSGTIPTETVTKDEKEGELIAEKGEKYVRSIGTVWGTYTDVQTFTQPYSEQSIAMNGKSDKLRYLKLFGLEIPLYLHKTDGYFIEKENYLPFVATDDEFPVGIKTVAREGYAFQTLRYDKEQAQNRAEELAKNYEENFLSDCEIKSRETDVEFGEDGVTLTVNYEVYGVMSEERSFLIG